MMRLNHIKRRRVGGRNPAGHTDLPGVAGSMVYSATIANGIAGPACKIQGRVRIME